MKSGSVKRKSVVKRGGNNDGDDDEKNKKYVKDKIAEFKKDKKKYKAWLQYKVWLEKAKKYLSFNKQTPRKQVDIVDDFITKEKTKDSINEPNTYLVVHAYYKDGEVIIRSFFNELELREHIYMMCGENVEISSTLPELIEDAISWGREEIQERKDWGITNIIICERFMPVIYGDWE